MPMRKEVSEFVKELQKDGIKISYAKVARQFNCDYRTVKRYCEEEQTEKKPRKAKVSKLDPFKSMIEEKVDACCSYNSIYLMLRKRGYSGKYSILANYCKRHHDAQTRKATIRFETTPGLQGQVDWKEDMTLHTRSGEAITIQIFLFLLGYSRTKYIELTLDKSQDTLKKAMISAFQYIGGVPKEIIFDNMKTVVDQSKTQYRNAVINEKFYSFSKDMGFEVWACRPYRPQTKGKVEALARTMERLRPYDYEFDSIEELDKIVNELRDDLNAEISKATGKTPNELLNKEKEYLRPLPNKDILESYLTTPLVRTVSKESMIAYRKQKYSLQTHYIGKTVELKEVNGKLEIYYKGILIETHEIVEHKPFNYKLEHMEEILRSDSMKYSEDNEIRDIAIKNLQAYDALGGA
jgi:transposase